MYIKTFYWSKPKSRVDCESKANNENRIRWRIRGVHNRSIDRQTLTDWHVAQKNSPGGQMQSGQTSKSSYQHYANTDEAFWQIHEGPYSSIRFFIAVGFESRLDQHWLLVFFAHMTEHTKKKGWAFVKFQTLELGWTHPSTSHVFRFLHLLQNGWQTKSCKEHTRRIDISFVVFWFFTNSRASLGSLAEYQVGIIGNLTMRVAWYTYIYFFLFTNFRKIIRFATYCKT